MTSQCCPKCKTIYLINTETCSYCGGSLPEPASDDGSPTTIEAPSPRLDAEKALDVRDWMTAPGISRAMNGLDTAVRGAVEHAKPRVAVLVARFERAFIRLKAGVGDMFSGDAPTAEIRPRAKAVSRCLIAIGGLHAGVSTISLLMLTPESRTLWFVVDYVFFVLMVLWAAWARRRPRAAVNGGIASVVGLHGLLFLINPRTLLSGWILKIVYMALLMRAWRRARQD